MSQTPTEKKVKNPMLMQAWLNSEAYATYVGFVCHINDAVKGKSLSAECSSSDGVKKMLSILDTLSQWIDEIPCLENPQRFGNQAFRIWHKRLSSDENRELLVSLLPEDKKDFVPELFCYWIDSFGNSTRIDYGTGHEAAFAMFLCCLFKLSVFEESDSIAAVNLVFHRYLKLMRKLQKTYKMEPAGSQGVYSLDDYHFLPFIWGSSQLLENPSIEPSSYTDTSIVEKNAKEFMFMEAIQFINEVKTGPFAEHSNQLWNISAVQSWSKVNSGLIKMYKNEVLNKFPVVQHFWFGSLLPFEPLKKSPP